MQQQVFQLFQGLTFFGSAIKTEIGVVIEVAYAGGGGECQLFLVDVLVDNTAGTIHQDSVGHLCEEHIAGTGAGVNAETDLHVFRFQTIDFHRLHLTDGVLLNVSKIGDITRL